MTRKCDAVSLHKWFVSLAGVIIVAMGAACSGITVDLSGMSGTLITGNGQVRSETRDVEGFTSIRVQGAGDVIIDRGDAEGLVIEAEDNLLPYLVSEVVDGVLVLRTADDYQIVTTQPLRYRIQYMTLEAVDVAGSATITANGLDGDSFALTLDGDASATLNGRVAAQTHTVNGSATIRGFGLAGERAAVVINGSGSVEVSVSDQLDVAINGAGSVRYRGNPRVTEDINGVGSVSAAN